MACGTSVPFAANFLPVYIQEVYTMSMRTTKVFKSGNSQAVRLPKEFQFDSDEIEIFRRGDEVVLRKKSCNLARAFALLTSLPADFLQEGREDERPQDREDF